ncbi:FAD-dependent oxidoreductase [Craterilacuibacter sp. RT1T]|uniref:NAD(P)/FAD-dependent oxidoreductase n=1 Tax=Craterilacuibacter sp. RT1T TaxID=2942211 RepID=UPI0020C0A0B7|nr:FAD-dependent oxidoreductase [Craterilacuibacter sp. RT1T]MCL6262449.1 FAD-dependent oxidoreductase [Craterilacuibacter sp. RT1T]
MKIAIVGSGIAGLSCAWLLERAGNAVTLFEAANYAGGHSNTVDVTLDGLTHPVDTGFLVHNTHTYPNLIALFAELGVQTCPSEMTFSVTHEADGVEWAGSNLATLFAQKRNLLRPRFWGMLRDILRLHRLAPALQAQARQDGATLGEILDRHHFGDAMRRWYLLPMGAAIWSTSTRGMLDFSAAAFFEFCANHSLLQVNDRPQWRTLVGGSRQYVQKICASLSDLRLNCPVMRVRREHDGVWVDSRCGREHFDQIVFACHTDQTLALLESPKHAEHALLSAIRYPKNRTLLHTDPSFLPDRKALWSAWNYRMARHGRDSDAVTVSYLINQLQPLPFSSPVIVTLNPHREPKGVLAEFDYAHPLLDQHASTAQARLDSIQGQGGVWFAGAWTGNGFHEDGLKAGMRVAIALGASVPWPHPLKPIAQASAPQNLEATPA